MHTYRRVDQHADDGFCGRSDASTLCRRKASRGTVESRIRCWGIVLSCRPAFRPAIDPTDGASRRSETTLNEWWQRRWVPNPRIRLRDSGFYCRGDLQPTINPRNTASSRERSGAAASRVRQSRCPLSPQKRTLISNGRPLRAKADIRYAARSTRASISLRSIPKSIGLVKSPSAPACKALRFVSASPYAVIMMIGTSGRTALALGSSSRPDIPGMLISDRTKMSDASPASAMR